MWLGRLSGGKKSGKKEGHKDAQKLVDRAQELNAIDGWKPKAKEKREEEISRKKKKKKKKKTEKKNKNKEEATEVGGASGSADKSENVGNDRAANGEKLSRAVDGKEKERVGILPPSVSLTSLAGSVDSPPVKPGCAFSSPSKRKEAQAINGVGYELGRKRAKLVANVG